MKTDWQSLSDLAQARGLSLAEARSLAERMHWPMVFKTRETLVLAPPAAPEG
ncbi:MULTISPECIES: hypothetical protein [Methylobacterium]|uniref:Uncharacterized protein n=1 Tax=Methylobacterium jeotgali TaxID=381630 RepID=A0ABQ4T2N1_9HYPH|nr:MULTISPECIES: hypothetical protein [Methylobacterium]GBU19583.1 hypothetical protein AwMethylo_37980 [Methylobacterium sp.]GJE08510.1 hypothetical protein AOPFMNJM_3849 [Methylobacterium jeotgali]